MSIRSAALALLVAACGGTSLPPCDAAGGEGLAPAQCDALHALALPDALPPARGNRFGDSTDAAILGHRLFFDARFSSSGEIRCATCHKTESNFQDDAPTPPHFDVVRNTPSILNAARMRWQFWDGRADSVWSQALVALENPAEMNFTRLEIAHQVAAVWTPEYEKAFGPLPDLSDAARFPPRGAPGDPAWEAMSAADRATVETVAANVGKAIEAYERRAAAGASALDRHLGGDSQALSGAAKHGLAVFARAGCLECHSGPMLTDEKFHDLGLPLVNGVPDDGRATAVAVLAASHFNAQGPYFDGVAQPLPEAWSAAVGAFRTPSLRNLGRTAPYGHGGQFATLEEVVDFHLRGGGGLEPLLQPQSLSAADRDALLAFLRSLDGKYPSLPWADWPGH